MRSRFLYLGGNRVREFKEIKEFKDYMVGIITKFSKFSKFSKLTKHTIFLSPPPNFLAEWCGSGASQKKPPWDSTL